jgi:FAD/FMN-containing dehydrogenase
VTIAAVSSTGYLEDASGMHGQAEKAFAPSTTSELREIVSAAVAGRIPLTVAGAGTGLTGAAVPDGGWVVSLNRFRKLEIQAGKARCGVGLSLQELQDEAAKTGQFFGPNPTEYSASIGGIISTNAGGARSFCFRSVRHHVLGMEVTFMNGETKWLQRNEAVPFPFTPVRQPATTKNSAGYYLPPGLDWINLLSGSEGTLGIITEVDLQLLPTAPAILSGVVFFSSDADSLNAVDEWRSVPRLRLLEYLDGASLDFMRPKHSDIPAGARAALLIEQDLASESDDEVDLWVDRLTRHRALADDSWFGFAANERERFRAFRHALASSVVERVRRNGMPKIGTDFAVPIERSRELLAYYRQRCAEAFPDKYLIFGHIGDANVHLNVLPDSLEESRLGEKLMYEMAQFAVSLGGTVAAEHGIGKNKRDLLRLMYSPEEIESMKHVKRTLDPLWLLGRGTIFENPEAVG